MGYKFPLATVLRVRAIREEREERMLQQITFELVQAKNLLQQANEALVRINNNRHTRLSAVVQGSDVHASYGELAGLKQHKSDIEAHITKLEDLRKRQVLVLDKARCDREMISDMKEQQTEAYDLDMAKREQKMLDDNFASRMNR